MLASWLFVQYLLTNEIQMGYAETEGYLPVTLKAQNSAEYQEYLSRKGEDGKEHYDIKIEASETPSRTYIYSFRGRDEYLNDLQEHTRNALVNIIHSIVEESINEE